jgi:hypothetical protein
MVALLIILSGTATTTAAAQVARSPDGSSLSDDDSPRERESGRARLSRKITAGFATSYHEDAFNLRRHWSDGSEIGGRLAGYSSPWDVVSDLGIAGEHEWRWADKRRVRLGASANYRHYAIHGAHNRAGLGLTAQYRAPGSARTALELEWIPSALAGNKRNPDDGVHARADYKAASVSLGHRRHLSETVALRTAAEYSVRRFDAPFGYLDRDLVRTDGRLDLDVGGAVLSGTAGAGRAWPALAEHPLAEGRGYSMLEGGAIASWEYRGTEFRGRGRLQSRSFDLPEGSTERQDLTWRFDARGRRPLTARTAMWLQVGQKSRSIERDWEDGDLFESTNSGRFLRVGADFTP